MNFKQNKQIKSSGRLNNGTFDIFLENKRIIQNHNFFKRRREICIYTHIKSKKGLKTEKCGGNRAN